MPQVSRCPECGCEIPPDSPAGICPDCLLKQGLDSQHDSDAAPGAVKKTVITPPSTGFVPPEPNEIASHFPQLEIQGLLGQGGMGAVYQARQTKLDRQVALKIIKPESADDPAFAERFMREARTLARLNHPNIVAVHDFGEADELYYFIMEYVDGANLRQLLESQELGPDQALAVVPQICEALQFAHDEGVVHRDIKPENILVDSKGRVKIADFGLARLIASSPQDFTLTGTHQVMGTPRYMAPEQMAGSHGVDHRADIYSVGVVFYEMLTGEVPMGQFEPPSKKASVDRRLDEVVLRALAREPERRFQQASEMKSRVELISSHPDDPAATSLESAAPPRPVGVSTIAEREVQNVWRWVSGEPQTAEDQRSTFPALLMIALSIAGCLMILLPWMDLEIRDRKVSVVDEFVVDGVQQTTAGNKAGHLRTLYGSDRWPGITTAVAFVVLALLLLTIPSRQRPTFIRAALLTGVSAVAVLHTFLFKLDLESGSFPIATKPAAAKGADAKTPRSRGQAVELPAATASSESEFAPLYELQHRIMYRSGFYGSLGLSLGLLLLSAVGIRHAVGQRGASRPEGSQGTDPPLTSLRFSAPSGQDIGSQVVFHFSGLGYQLLDEQPGVWVFQRGNKLGGLWATDIRSLHTTLTVRTAVGNEGELLVSCVWAVRTLAAWIGGRDIEKLEAEGHELQLLLGGDDRGTNDSDAERLDTPRFSRKAIVGAAIAPFSLVLVWLGWEVWIHAGPGALPLLAKVLLIPAIAAPFATTILGLIALSEIRNSDGRLTGLGLAIADASVFPLLIINGAIFGVLLFFHYSGMEMNFAMSFGLALGETAMIGGWLSSDIIKRVWNAGSRPVEETPTPPPIAPPAGLADEAAQHKPMEIAGQVADSVGDRPQLTVAPQPDRFPDLDIRRIEMQLKGPAGGLIVVAILALAFWCVNGAILIEDEYRHSRSGLTSLEIAGIVGGAIAVLLLVATMIGGARKMRRLKGYELCMAACILAMLPTTGAAMILGLPIGIWAFRMLRRPDVRDAFIARAIANEKADSGPQSAKTDDDEVSMGWAFTWWISCVLIFVVAPVVFGVWYEMRKDQSSSIGKSSTPRNGIAVLRFVSVGDPSNPRHYFPHPHVSEAFCTKVTDAVRRKITQNATRLLVKPSSESYQNVASDGEAISAGQALQVKSVLMGILHCEDSDGNVIPQDLSGKKTKWFVLNVKLIDVETGSLLLDTVIREAAPRTEEKRRAYQEKVAEQIEKLVTNKLGHS